MSPGLLSQIMDMQKTLQALAETNSKLMIEIGRSKKTNAYQHQYSLSRDEQEPTAFLGKRKILGNQQQQQQFSSSDSESVGTGAPSSNFSDDIRSQLYEKSGRADRRRQFKERRYYYYNSSYNIILIIRLLIY